MFDQIYTRILQARQKPGQRHAVILAARPGGHHVALDDDAYLLQRLCHKQAVPAQGHVVAHLNGDTAAAVQTLRRQGHTVIILPEEKE